MWQSIKKYWLKFVTLWNNTVIYCFLLVIWFLVLTPTAIIRRFFLKIFYYKKKNSKSFLKKSPTVLPEHFKNPF